MTNSNTPIEGEETPVRVGTVVGTVAEVRRLAHLVEENGLSELMYDAGDLRIVLRTAAFRQSEAAPPAISAHATTSVFLPMDTSDEADLLAAVEESDAPTRDESRLVRIEAPIMGVFYRASSQGAPPLVEVGDVLAEGQVIGLIEAMKVFSEVPTSSAGRVLEIPVKNGALVQPGDALIVLETE